MDAFAHYEKIEVDEDELPEVDAEEVALHNTPVCLVSARSGFGR